MQYYLKTSDSVHPAPDWSMFFNVTFLNCGLTMWSSNASSGWITFKCSLRMLIFFIESQPAGLFQKTASKR